MSLVVQHNLPALNAQNQLRVNLNNNQKATEKLSSGYRINRAGDDAAGLAISEKMRGQIRGLDQAVRNAQDGISLIQTAEGALQETHSILQRMRELAVQSANGTYQNEVDRENINKEVDALKSEIDRIATSTHFNGKKLLDGTMAGEEIPGNGASVATADADAVKATMTAASATVANVDEIAIEFADIDGDVTVEAQNALRTALSSSTITATSDETNVTFTGTIEGFTLNSDGTITDGTNTIATLSGDAGDAGTSNITFSGGAAATPAVSEGDVIAAQNGSGQLVLQIGANGVQDQEVTLDVASQTSESLGIGTINVGTREAAKLAIEDIDNAINSVSGTRADLGSLQNRLEYTINNLSTTSENLTAAESRIRDTDMAKEMMNFTKSNILQQAAQAMLAQANAQPQSVLQLLG